MDRRHAVCHMVWRIRRIAADNLDAHAQILQRLTELPHAFNRTAVPGIGGRDDLEEFHG
ncbi:hypothetical protein [Polaromonas sp. CG9_12]|nr:hypothetical protein [Polaromonas sp. CG9_12]